MENFFLIPCPSLKYKNIEIEKTKFYIYEVKFSIGIVMGLWKLISDCEKLETKDGKIKLCSLKSYITFL